MIKKTILMIMILIIMSSVGFATEGDDESLINTDKIIEDQIKNLKLDELQEIIIKVNETTGDYLPKIGFKEYVIALIKGEEVIKSEEILTSILSILFKEVLANAALLAKLMILSIICAILTNLQNAFEKNTVGEIAYYVCYLILIAIAIKSFTIGMEVGREAIGDMVLFMQALLPTLITLLLAMGGITSSAIFHPLILGALSAVSTLMKTIILPLIFIATIIGVISKLSDKIQITKLAGLLRQISIGIIGVSLTVFIGIMSIQGATSAKVDGVTIRTAKFAVDKFIPIVGSFLSDAMDTVVGCSMLLKNAIGVIGLIVLFLICAIPILKIVALIFVYKIIGAVIEPISDARIVDCLSEISKSLTLVFAAIASVAFMFFIAITIIISAGNVTVMLR